MKRYDLIVVGAGPAGLSAAIEAAKIGLEVAVFDENSKPGGQLFKQIHKFFGSKEHKAKIRGFKIG
ncbi:FAD-dependent oxidoreductase, partial [Ilyobacter sp.]|uniref:FAD-dependent oxidoreductase n=1 Tax=Ilyobacter sp. TaxID=3100343 RepID=UPI00356AC548